MHPSVHPHPIDTDRQSLWLFCIHVTVYSNSKTEYLEAESGRGLIRFKICPSVHLCPVLPLIFQSNFPLFHAHHFKPALHWCNHEQCVVLCSLVHITDRSLFLWMHVALNTSRNNCWMLVFQTVVKVVQGAPLQLIQ